MIAPAFRKISLIKKMAGIDITKRAKSFDGCSHSLMKLTKMDQ